MPEPVDPQQALERLRAAAASGELDAICERWGVRVLGAFGSTPRRSRHPEDPSPRDLDVSVSFARQPHVLELLDELTRLTGYDGIDLLVLDDAEPVARAEGHVGIGLHEREAGDWANGQMAALAVRRDTAHLRRLDLDTLRSR